MGIVSRPPTINPGQGWAINWQHPLAKGLATCVIATPNGFVDLVYGSNFKPPSLVIEPTKRGIATSNTSTNGLATCMLPKQPPRPSSAFTLAYGFIGKPQAVGTWGGGLSSWTADQANPCPYESRINATKHPEIEIWNSAGTNFTNTATGTVPDGTYADLIWSWSSTDTNVTCFLNGKQDSTFAGPSDLKNAGNLGLYSYWTVGASDGLGNHSIAYFFAWNDRRLTAVEVAQLYANPYQILMPVRRMNVAALTSAASLAATLNATSSLTPALSLSKPLAASTSAISTITPALSLGKPLAAAPAAVSTITPAVAVGKPLAVSIAAVSTVTSSIALSVPLGTSFASVATITASLAGGNLAANLAAVSSITAAISIGKPLGASVASVTTLTPALGLSVNLASSFGGVSTITPAIALGKTLAAAPASVSTITASLTNTAGSGMAANLSAVSTVTAALSLSKPMAAALSVQSTVTAALSNANTGWIISTPTLAFWHQEDFFLMEDGGYFLLEDGARLMLDTPPGDPWSKSAATVGAWSFGDPPTATAPAVVAPPVVTPPVTTSYLPGISPWSDAATWDDTVSWVD